MKKDGRTTRTVISKSRKRKTVIKGGMSFLAFMGMVVYKTKVSKGKCSSKTKHEICN